MVREKSEFRFYSGKMEIIKKLGKSDLGEGKLGFYEHDICRRQIPSYPSAITMCKNIGLYNCKAIFKEF